MKGGQPRDVNKVAHGFASDKTSRIASGGIICRIDRTGNIIG